MKRNRKNSSEFQKVLLFLGVLLVLLVGSFFIGMYLGDDTAGDPMAGKGPKVVGDAVLERSGDEPPATEPSPEDRAAADPRFEPETERAEQMVSTETRKKSAPLPKRVEETPAEEPRRVYSVQVGAFRKKAQAETLSAALKKKGYDAYVVGEKTRGKGFFYKVRIGRYRAKKDADTLAGKIRNKDGMQTFVTYR